MTNVGGFGNNTTLGVITGDIKCAVGVEILGIKTASDGTTTLTVQHHLVTETGDTVFIDQALGCERIIRARMRMELLMWLCIAASKLDREMRKAPDRLGLGPTCRRAQITRASERPGPERLSQSRQIMLPSWN
jgi:hypothetical protein